MLIFTEEAGSVDKKGESQGPEVVILFVAMCLVLGIASRHFFRGTRVPYTAALLLLGIGLGVLEYSTHRGLGKLGASIRVWANINPNLILFVFLPALIFEGSFAMEMQQIKGCMVQMMLLAGPGVVISTFCLGTAIHFLFPYGWNWKVSLLLGALLGATDPVAVVALLKEVGASKKLSTLIEGESMMNDGVAIVVYKIFFQMLLGKTFNVMEVIKFLSHVILGALALGLAFGLVSYLWLRVFSNDTVIEITMTLAVSYLAYYIAEDAVEASGILTVLTLGIFYAAVSRTAFKLESQQNIHHIWEMVAYIANTIIFILSGVIIAESICHSQDTIAVSAGQSWGLLILLYCLVQVTRVIVVAILSPGLLYFGYGLDLKEAVIVIWSGLRGAVSLSLALVLNQSSSSLSISLITQKTGALFVFFTGGVVFLTIILNGSTTQFLLQLLGMTKTSGNKMQIADHTKYEMNHKALEAFRDLREDEELGQTDWPSVVKYITCLKTREGGQTHSHGASINENELHQMNMHDTRLRLLNGVQAAYCGMLDEGRIREAAANLLMQSVDEAIEMVASHEKLLDWKQLAAHVQIPSYLKYFQNRFLPQKLVTFFTVERLELPCFICAAFLRAHRIARRQLHEFIGETEVAEAVIQESEAEGEPAKQFLEDVQLTFPQVLHMAKTKQVAYSILLRLSEYVQNLEKCSLLEAKEMNQLHDAVQINLKKILSNPPLVRMPSVTEMLSSHPFFGALPSNIQQRLGTSAREKIISRRASLYKEGSKPDGICLIANGVVQWRNKHNANRHMLHPTFSHGSTLGLYEALTGRPHLCDLTADSVVHCLLIETDEVLSSIQSTPSIEDFFWQESAMVIAKLLLPQQFEEMSMQEMRTLVFERSTMHTYLRGEMIEILPYDVAILLEGFVKQEGSDEFTEAPAVVVPAHAEYHLASTGDRHQSSTHRTTWIQADTCSRIILFNFSSIHSESHLHRASASLLSHNSLVRRHFNQKYEDLLCWPNKQYTAEHADNKDMKHEQRRSKSLVAKAMQLSVFGSMVNLAENNPSGRFLRAARGTERCRSFSSVRSQIKMFSSLSTMRWSKSEGSITSGPLRIPTHHDPTTSVRRPAAADSNEGSDAKDEHTVLIDSPSYLFNSI